MDWGAGTIKGKTNIKKITIRVYIYYIPENYLEVIV
jgi:hypothetical protein